MYALHGRTKARGRGENGDRVKGKACVLNGLQHAPSHVEMNDFGMMTGGGIGPWVLRGG